MFKLRCSMLAIIAVGMLILSNSLRAAQVDVVNGDLIAFQPDGGWSWYEDERIMVADGQIVVGSVAAKRQGDFPIQNFTRNPGDIIATTYNLSNGKRSFFELHNTLELDDHNAPSFLALPDGNYLASYTKHATDGIIRIRKTTVPGDTTSWGPRIDFQRELGDPFPPSGKNDVTYTNLHYLADEGTGQGRVYNFFRNRLESSWDRHFIYSDDLGDRWQYGGRLTGQNNVTIRPYTKYADNGRDKIYFVTSEANGGQNIWAGYVQGGKTYRMDGTVADNNLFDETAPAVGNLTSVMMGGTVVGGVPMEDLWPIDIALDSSGYPVTTFRAYGNGVSTDRRHFYARWNGTQWSYNQLAYAGTTFNTLDPAGNTINSSLAVLDPNDPSISYFSSNVNPQDGTPLVSAADGVRHFEIFKGTTPDGGQTWTYTPITQNSSVDNIRPTVAKWDSNHTAVVWMRGTHDHWLYKPSSSNYAFDTAIVGLVEETDRTRSTLTYQDANLTNTVLADGTPWTLGSNYTTSAATGANDNRWHLQTDAAFGNGGTLFTANETSPFNESAGVLKTTVNAPGAGTYDVFALFWSPAQKLNEWRLAATLDFDGDGQHTDEQMIALDRTTAQHALANDFSTPVLVEEAGNRHLYRGFLGTITVADGEPIQVYIDDLANTDAVPVAGVTWPGTGWRTWYDGVAIARVALPGDYNTDGTVDAADYVIWRKGFGAAPVPADYETWQANFGRTGNGGAGASTGGDATVPEPNFWLSMTAGLAAIITRRAQR